MTDRISAQTLRDWIVDEDELALLDVREEGVFGADGHLLFAVCLPLSALELRIEELVPRKSVRVVLCDGDDGLAEKAAEKLTRWGYQNVSILDGGIAAWEKAGFVLFRGVNVPSKAFGEFVEHQSETPSIPPEELKSMIDSGEDLIVLDSRPWGEYRRMNIPTGIDCPGAELAYRVHDLVDNPDKTIVVNCAGRTRSIIGAQSLINAGVPNPVIALRNGTMGWALAGFELETGSDRNFLPVSEDGLAQARACADRVAARFGVEETDLATVDRWREESETRTLFLLDVRNPDEFEAGHLPGSYSAPGGQLVQATDRWAGTLGARLVLVDDTGVRATMTASWLLQMGWQEVRILTGIDKMAGLESGIPQTSMPDFDTLEVEEISAADLKDRLSAGEDVTVVDFANSLEYKAGHIPGSWWAVRSRLPQSAKKIPGTGTVICTSPDGILARYAAADMADITGRPVLTLTGGTDAWVAAKGEVTAGFENMADTNNDIQYKAYDHDDNIEFHMQEYLSWEIGLVELIEADGTARFRHVPA